jgi:hypothetical protein
MEDPDSLAADDSVADQCELVSKQCPTVQLTNVWLLKMVWVRPMPKPEDGTEQSLGGGAGGIRPSDRGRPMQVFKSCRPQSKKASLELGGG